jgi:hypothetical protein
LACHRPPCRRGLAHWHIHGHDICTVWRFSRGRATYTCFVDPNVQEHNEDRVKLLSSVRLSSFLSHRDVFVTFPRPHVLTGCHPLSVLRRSPSQIRESRYVAGPFGCILVTSPRAVRPPLVFGVPFFELSPVWRLNNAVSNRRSSFLLIICIISVPCLLLPVLNRGSETKDCEHLCPCLHTSFKRGKARNFRKFANIYVPAALRIFWPHSKPPCGPVEQTLSHRCEEMPGGNVFRTDPNALVPSMARDKGARQARFSRGCLPAPSFQPNSLRNIQWKNGLNQR